MKVKELIAQLQKSEPEADVTTGFWNGHVNTYLREPPEPARCHSEKGGLFLDMISLFSLPGR